MLIGAAQSSEVLLELGALLVVLAVLGRVAAKFGIPSIPLYLVAGLLLGEGSAIPLAQSETFVRVAADIGVVLLLLLLGLEYTPSELGRGLRSGWAAGLVDLVANSLPGFVVALALDWSPTEAVVLAGVTYVSSSGIIAKQLVDLGRVGNPESPTVLSLLVIEDLVMVAYLPLVGVLLAGSDAGVAALSIAAAVSSVVLMLAIAGRFGHVLSRLVDAPSTEVLLLNLLGLTLLIGGLAERVDVSAAVAAFIVGVALSERVAVRGSQVLEPIRDVFGGLFFVFFGLQVDPATLTPVLVPAAALAVLGVASKFVTGWWAARRAALDLGARVRAGASLVPRGEFSIVIGGLAVASGAEPDLGPLTACYVLLLAVIGSLVMRFADVPAQRRGSASRTALRE